MFRSVKLFAVQVFCAGVRPPYRERLFGKLLRYPKKPWHSGTACRMALTRRVTGVGH